MAQVKRLISRDRKEFMGNNDDILDKYTKEFGDGISGEAAAAAASSLSAGERPSLHGAAWRGLERQGPQQPMHAA